MEFSYYYKNNNKILKNGNYGFKLKNNLNAELKHKQDKLNKKRRHTKLNDDLFFIN